jgi:ADP-ribosylglycohydrolase
VAAATKQWITSGREAAPNGSLMRTHPIGILAVGMSEDEARQLSTEVGMTTHVDPRCTVSSAVAVTVIRGILRGEIVNEDTLDDAIERGYNWIFSAPNSFDLLYPGSDPDTPREQLSNSLDPEEFFRYVYAKGYDDLQLDDRSSIGYVFKCLGAGMYVLRLGMRSTDPQALPPGELFETLMTDLVMQSGDADTNATVAGALLGAWLGYTSLPARWAGGLKYREWLIQKARRAITLLGITEGELEPEDDEKPDGGKGLMSEAELAVRDREFVAMMLQKDHDRRERERKKKTADSHSGRGSWFWRTVGYSH